MAKMATTNATMQPKSNSSILVVVAQLVPSLNISNRSNSVAPAIVGTAKKNENSAARLRVSPCCIPPTMVDMLRLMPGMTDKHWKQPILKARFQFTSFVLSVALNSRSQNNMNTPPNTKVMATTVTLSKSQSKRPLFLANNPTTTAGKTPTISSP